MAQIFLKIGFLVRADAMMIKTFLKNLTGKNLNLKRQFHQRVYEKLVLVHIPKAQKIQSRCQSFLRFWDICSYKLPVNMLMKVNPSVNFPRTAFVPVDLIGARTRYNIITVGHEEPYTNNT